MMDNALFDMLGILAAFIMVILLLSLIVTSLVQITQATFGIRGKNLHHAVSRMLTELQIDQSGETRKEGKKTAKKNANELMNAVPAALLTRSASTNPFFRIWGSGVSWIEADEFEEAVDRKKHDLGLKDFQVTEIKEGFKKIEKPMQKRLKRSMRYVTVGWAIAVAVCFQVSTPALLGRLSGDEELVGTVLASAESNYEDVEKAITRLKSYEDVAAQALEELEASHPDAGPDIEEAAGIGSTREEIVAELNDVLADDEMRDEIVADYERRLDELVEENRLLAIHEASMAMQNLSLFGIEPWGDASFYWSGGKPQIANIVGVAITAFLLSFGAPFWFDRLKEVAGLRDALKKLTPKEQDGNANTRKPAAPEQAEKPAENGGDGTSGS
jgi:hypothetical protein